MERRLRYKNKDMKLILLFDGSKQNYGNLLWSLRYELKTSPTAVDTQRERELVEEDYILQEVNRFSRGDSKIMTILFSGRDCIVTRVGELSPHMVVTLSDNPNSKYYSEKPIDTFIEFTKNYFLKETEFGTTT